MKKFFLTIPILLCFSGCLQLQESRIQGDLAVNRSWGDQISLIDAKSRQSFGLSSGRYILEMPRSVPFTNPEIRVLSLNNELLGTITIPRELIKQDGSFQGLSRDPNKIANLVNVIGGRRKMRLAAHRYARDNVTCPVTVVKPCTKTDSEGRTYSDSCVETVPGRQDEVREKVTYRTNYRILFDAGDFMNAAVFNGQSSITSEDRVIASSRCIPY
jgi:hypothetical protein